MAPAAAIRPLPYRPHESTGYDSPMSETLSLQRAAQWYERHGRRLPPLANLALAIVVAWLLSKMVWALMPVPEAARWQPPPPPPAPARAGRTPSAGIDRLLAAQLFGRYEAEAAPAGNVEDAPDTRLSLNLLGILAGADRESRALIGTSNGEEKPYAIGDTVVSGVKLQSIFADRVILSRAGKLETLRLNKDAPSSAQAVAARNASAAAALPQTDANTAQMLSQIREQIMSDPTKASNYLRVQPATVGGQQRGYRIYPGREREAFQQLGLRPGDLVTAVNGVQLDDNQKALQLLGQLSQANAISLTIERGGQVQNLNVTLGP
ncbi:type II secretion system protein C (GspC) [Sinimarinibacterium flocculans]|uniref:Type II secretion system protein C (GspC) n=2 Tax=Sinimarinibacterium flocculans TaxID=985250 RepID=A0A318E9R7_9GAMM|nr:type II secretion system protein C (GspC) [Sinimarinibacterium flocculans]